jgi:hypothetical protein
MHKHKKVKLLRPISAYNIKAAEKSKAPIVKYGFLCIPYIGTESDKNPNTNFNDQGSD